MSTTFSIEDCSFMAGSWAADIWGGVFEEAWLPAFGGTMVGVGRHTLEGKTTFQEFEAIECVSETWTLFVLLGSLSKGAKTAIPFELVEFVAGESCTFANPANEFPTHIRYDREPDGSLRCVISGRADGGEESEVFEFRRVL